MSIKVIIEKLSAQELQVMLMIINGHKILAIADRLGLSPKVIKNYRYNIFDKLSVISDAELINLAIRYGIYQDILLL